MLSGETNQSIAEVDNNTQHRKFPIVIMIFNNKYQRKQQNYNKKILSNKLFENLRQL